MMRASAPTGLAHRPDHGDIASDALLQRHVKRAAPDLDLEGTVVVARGHSALLRRSGRRPLHRHPAAGRRAGALYRSRGRAGVLLPGVCPPARPRAGRLVFPSLARADPTAGIQGRAAPSATPRSAVISASRSAPRAAPACPASRRAGPKPLAPSSVLRRSNGTRTSRPCAPRRALPPASRGRRPTNVPASILVIREPDMESAPLHRPKGDAVGDHVGRFAAADGFGRRQYAVEIVAAVGSPAPP